MDREWLAHRLAAGDSYEAIGRELHRHPSTVSYWARLHGLSSVHGSVHAARGGLERDALAALVDAGLSTRENDVLDCLLENLSNKEIGSRLSISERTVKFHVSNLLGKFGVQRRADLILQAYQARTPVEAGR